MSHDSTERDGREKGVLHASASNVAGSKGATETEIILRECKVLTFKRKVCGDRVEKLCCRLFDGWQPEWHCLLDNLLVSEELEPIHLSLVSGVVLSWRPSCLFDSVFVLFLLIFFLLLLFLVMLRAGRLFFSKGCSRGLFSHPLPPHSLFSQTSHHRSSSFFSSLQHPFFLFFLFFLDSLLFVFVGGVVGSNTLFIPGFGSVSGPVGPDSQHKTWIEPKKINADDNYDVIVVGGGHAGCEAASAAARVSFLSISFSQHYPLIQFAV